MSFDCKNMLFVNFCEVIKLKFGGVMRLKIFYFLNLEMGSQCGNCWVEVEFDFM